VKIRSLLLIISVCSAALQVCAEDARAAEPSTKECPDLTGTYEVRSTEWIDKFPFAATGAMRPTTQTKQFATFQSRGGGYTLIWHMPRQDVLAAARLQAQRDPHKYGTWLDMVLRDPKLPLPLGVSEQEWFNRLAIFGPVFRADAVLPLRQCKGGWFFFDSGTGAATADIEGGMDGARDAGLWLGRDKDGSLSLKWEEHRKLVLLQKSRYNNEEAIRLWSSAHLDKWPVAPAPDLTPIREEELPNGKRPSSQLPKCQIAEIHQTVFIQRLKANLPPKVEIDGYTSSIDYGRMRPDGVCDPTPYKLTVLAPDAATIAKVADYLRTDPFIRQIDSQESHDLGNGRLMVKFRMMVAP